MISRLAALLLRLAGWRSDYVPPPGPKAVVVFYPHTSNWDFPLGILFRARYGIDARWAGKDSLFRGPLRRVFLSMGGIPINRREPSGIVAALVDAFAQHDRLMICIAPEGTRSKTDHWKSGFYRLAQAAQVPVGLAYVDYRNKRIGLERWVELSGDAAADLALIAAGYADARGRYPDQAAPIRFKLPVGDAAEAGRSDRHGRSSISA